MKPTLSLEQKTDLRLQQKLIITPQMQQAIELLLLDRQDLEQAIIKEIEENPFLEMKKEDDEEPTQEENNSNNELNTTPELEPLPQLETKTELQPENRSEQPLNREENPPESREEKGESEEREEIDWEEYFRNSELFSRPEYYEREARDPDQPTWESRVRYEENLYENLIKQ